MVWHVPFLFEQRGHQDIYVSRLGHDGHFGAGKIVEELSTEFEDIMPNVRVRDDGSFEIVYSSYWPTGSWSAPRNLGAAVNTAGVEQRSTLSHDGKRLYFGRDGDIFMSNRPGQH